MNSVNFLPCYGRMGVGTGGGGGQAPLHQRIFVKMISRISSIFLLFFPYLTFYFCLTLRFCKIRGLVFLLQDLIRKLPLFSCTAVAGVLDELYSQLTPLSGVAVQARQSNVSILRCLAGRYGYSAERAQLSKVRLKLPLQIP